MRLFVCLFVCCDCMWRGVVWLCGVCGISIHQNAVTADSGLCKCVWSCEMTQWAGLMLIASDVSTRLLSTTRHWAMEEVNRIDSPSPNGLWGVVLIYWRSRWPRLTKWVVLTLRLQTNAKSAYPNEVMWCCVGSGWNDWHEWPRPRWIGRGGRSWALTGLNCWVDMEVPNAQHTANIGTFTFLLF